MKNDNDIEVLFKQHSFDLHEPTHGHRNRFADKLSGHTNNNGFNWTSWLGVAASIVLVMSITGILFFSTAPAEAGELGSVSKEMKQTESFYSTAIKQELDQLKNNTSPEAKILLKDALVQVSFLEAEYQALKSDLIESEQDQRVVYAMITNFQQRIDLLKEVMEKITIINELKSTQNENHYL